jgi:hypothetical protein
MAAGTPPFFSEATMIKIPEPEEAIVLTDAAPTRNEATTTTETPRARPRSTRTARCQLHRRART